jgi:MFS family permease
VCTAFVTSATGMLVSRIFLALFEATMGPSLMLITAMWYTKSEQAPRFAIWHSAPGIGQILGGLMSYGFLGVPLDGRYWAGWRMMFIVLGALTLMVGIVTFMRLPDHPMNAKFLSVEEKVAILKHVSVNMTGISQPKYRKKELWEAAKDPQILMLVFPAILVSYLVIRLGMQLMI